MSQPQPPPQPPPVPPQQPRTQRPPPIPPQAINYATPGMSSRPGGGGGAGRDDYQRVADTVGMVPSLRWKDNVIQAVSIVAGLGIGAGVGALLARDPMIGAVIGGILGLVAALFISGIVLMILGWRRARRGR